MVHPTVVIHNCSSGHFIGICRIKDKVYALHPQLKVQREYFMLNAPYPDESDSFIQGYAIEIEVETEPKPTSAGTLVQRTSGVSLTLYH